MTPQAPKGSQGDTKSGDLVGAPDVEITPAMIDAGAEVIWRFFDETIPYGSSFGELVAREVFLAMNVSRERS
ncbi:MAG: hypothetical protein E7813_04225 [Bradyrhizobium sp.]|uniref:hypothetical protein n=1 Tax=Bradyrhizobium sp. TaxID=376 RepID=UPI00122A34D2|nr:hypothetical protein [Bradyrhizobium sp.]THD72478.1 MAG: hypothetical protein E7813_04225 [Bradyrhizobium sp.]